MPEYALTELQQACHVFSGAESRNFKQLRHTSRDETGPLSEFREVLFHPLAREADTAC
jgi:hypothetical protein